jgi:Zn-finger nucleic acid-binding protein
MNDMAIQGGVYNCPNCGAAAAAPESVRCAYCRSTLATEVCPACFGAIFVGMKHCPWCGAAAPAGASAHEIPLRCPRCNTSLFRVSLKDKTINACSTCGGLWLNKDTLQNICTDQESRQSVLGYAFDQKNIKAEGGRRQERAYIPCPECGKLMNRINFAGCSGIVVDWCKSHGTWFDRNELKQIVLFIQGGGLKKARERELARLEEEKLHLREEQRNLARIARLGGDSSMGTTVVADLDPLFQFLAQFWQDPSATR